MNRRDLIKGIALSPMFFSSTKLFAKNPPSKTLILIELKGGNDGLNTLVPFRDTVYQKLRPKLALSRESVYPINENLGLAKELTFFKKMFDQNNLAVLQGIGYENPNLSHFRSIDIWETASASDEFLYDGWITNALDKMSLKNLLSNGVIMGDFNLGPLRGSTEDILIIDNPKKIKRSGSLLAKHESVKSNEALDHILNVENQVAKTLSRLESGVKSSNGKSHGVVGKNKGQKEVQTLLDILKTDSRIPFFKLSLGGFDTHVGQVGSHKRLLSQLNDTFELLHKGLNNLGLWNNSLIVTYSEFGRRPQENANNGTDHGTANCHFAMGGGVKGGLYGSPWDLVNLQGGNLIFKTDFKDIYQTITDEWWGLNMKLSSNKVPFLRS